MHSIQCQCGAVKGQLESIGVNNRLICYCTDCRAFAHFLGKAPEVLDEQGGTEIVQVAQQGLHFSQGEDMLSAVRLSNKGMIRWYASCCATPIGNTMATPKASFIGLTHTCLDRSQVDKDFGINVAVLNTDTALGNPKIKAARTVGRYHPLHVDRWHESPQWAIRKVPTFQCVRFASGRPQGIES